MPQPMTPIVMRLDAGTRRARANGLAERAAAAAADCMNLRRVIAEDIGAPENGFGNAGRMITRSRAKAGFFAAGLRGGRLLQLPHPRISSWAIVGASLREDIAPDAKSSRGVKPDLS